MKPTKFKLIYNPTAGRKGRLLARTGATTLPELKKLFRRFEMPVDFVSTRRAGDGIRLAREAARAKYPLVIAAGGDGTVGEVANGLVGTQTALGIVPLGSFMNIARMLAIPRDIEQAVLLMKLSRFRTIDVGCIEKIDGEKLSAPYYFLESTSIGLDAEIQKSLVDVEQGQTSKLLDAFKSLFHTYPDPVMLTVDGKRHTVTANLITVANGPYMGAALKAAPQAKLNDHRIIVSIFTMTQWELIHYFARLLTTGKSAHRKIRTIRAQSVSITSADGRPLHADARLFGTTPAKFSIRPNALKVVYGFPQSERSLLHRNYYFLNSV